MLIGEDEPPENALKRFRWASKCTGLVMEVRLGASCSSVRGLGRKSSLASFLWCSSSRVHALQARRRMHFENRQDEKKRRIKEGHLKKSKCGPLAFCALTATSHQCVTTACTHGSSC